MTDITKHAPGTISWFDLMSTDGAKARAFYQALFGWTYDESGGDYAMCLAHGKKAAGIGGAPAGHPSAWTAYFHTTDAEATAKDITANGGKILMGPTVVGPAGRYTIAQDPTGAVFGTWEPKDHHGAEVRDEQGAMTWQECHTRDGNAAREFYCKTFKFEPVKIDAGPMNYWTLTRGKDMFGGVCENTHMPAHVPPHWLVYFNVDNTDATLAKVTAAGGKVMQPAMDTPYGRMAVCQDPMGGMFAVNQAPKQN
jgi:hypothetical protein